MKKNQIPLNQIMLAALLVCIVTVTIVLADNGAGGRWSIRAYIDPGTGSFIIQVLIASLIGVAYSIRNLRGNIKGYFLRLLHIKRRGLKKTDEN